MPEKPQQEPRLTADVNQMKSEVMLPDWLQSTVAGSEIFINSSLRASLPLVYSSTSHDVIFLSAYPITIPNGRYTWMGEGWVSKITKGTTKPINLRVGILRKTYPYTRKAPRYYYMPLDEI